MCLTFHRSLFTPRKREVGEWADVSTSILIRSGAHKKEKLCTDRWHGMRGTHREEKLYVHGLHVRMKLVCLVSHIQIAVIMKCLFFIIIFFNIEFGDEEALGSEVTSFLCTLVTTFLFQLNRISYQPITNSIYDCLTDFKH